MADHDSAQNAGERGRLDRGRADDVLSGEFGNPGLDIDKGPDGLPGVRPPTEMPHAPPLAVESFVCMADRSTFVIRRPAWGTVVATFQPDEVSRAENGRYHVDFLDAIDRGAPWLLVLRMMEFGSGRVPVEPIRPQCTFMARQMVDLQDRSDALVMERLCTARRDEESFFLSVRDQQVHACELRNPPAPIENARLDKFDDRKVSLGRQRRESADAFDVDRALAEADEAAKDTTPYGGIFADRPNDN